MKYLGTIVGIATFVLGIVLILGSYKEKVDKVEVVVEKHEEKIEENVLTDMQQSILLDSANQSLERQSRIIERLEMKL